jgi:hypothetical protein
MEGSGNFQREHEDKKVYNVYQRLRVLSEEAMQKHKDGEISLEKFKQVLNRFYGHYRTKWQKASGDVTEPDFMENRQFVDELSASECRELHFKLCELAEDLGDLGHMKELYKKKANKGGKSKADEIEEELKE